MKPTGLSHDHECDFDSRDDEPEARARWTLGLREEIAALFASPSVPTYGCLGLGGDETLYRGKPLAGGAFPERTRTRRVGKDPAKKRANDRRYELAHLEERRARKRTPEARARNREYLRRKREAAQRLKEAA